MEEVISTIFISILAGIVYDLLKLSFKAAKQYPLKISRLKQIFCKKIKIKPPKILDLLNIKGIKIKLFYILVSSFASIMFAIFFFRAFKLVFLVFFAIYLLLDVYVTWLVIMDIFDYFYENSDQNTTNNDFHI